MAYGNAVSVGAKYVEIIRLKATYGTITTVLTADAGWWKMSDLISRQAAIDIERNATVDTNPSHFEAHQKFTQLGQ